ncbi:mercury resistance system transport protein MerF [Salaquimonas pukyongi]|uniref:mercury resistance system transport protein MerF n=1 Tax=Salaquimonas pukyongi TaxID=2712698 RepID=UPI00096BA333|nr:mercury resistance system transport protein MerF [Salaquimonas pukyongi]
METSLGNRLLKTGVAGTLVTALCCFTPILVWLLTAIGLAGIIGYLDIVLFPALGVFVLVTGYAFWRRQTR